MTNCILITCLWINIDWLIDWLLLNLQQAVFQLYLKTRTSSRRVWRCQTEVIRICKSKKDRQHNGQKKKDKRTNNDLQNITHKTKDWVTRTPLNTRGKLRCYGGVAVPAPQVAPIVLLWLKTKYKHVTI